MKNEPKQDQANERKTETASVKPEYRTADAKPYRTTKRKAAK